MSSSSPRAGGPARRRVFTPAEKLAHLTAYETACQNGEGGGAYLRQEGLYSSQVTEWRKLRDGGALTGREAGEKIGKLTPEQAEIARLKSQLDKSERRLKKTEAALDIMGKTRALLEAIASSADPEPPSSRR